MHLEGVLAGELGTRGPRNRDHGPTWTFTELPEDLGSRFRGGQRAASTAVAQPGPRGGRGGRHIGPRPRRGLSEGLGVTRKDGQRLDAFLQGVGVVRRWNPPKLVWTERH